MVSSCANPACSATFRYLHEGIIFHVPVTSAVPDDTAASGAPTVERFWLCDECSSRITVIADPTGAFTIVLQELPVPAAGTAAMPKRWPSV